MVYKRKEEGLGKKPRGRPPTKSPNRSKARNKVLDDTGLESGVERGFIEVSPEQPLPSTENVIDLSAITMQLPPQGIETVNQILEQKEDSKQGEEKDKKEGEIVESLDFMNGNNKLSIRLTKQHNRMFRVQIFLNDGQLEVRPMTYTGSNTAMSFWSLLKGALSK